MFKKISIMLLIAGMLFSAFTCLCSHEKPVHSTATAHSCHEQSEETSQNPAPLSKDCCCIDKHDVGEIQEATVFNSANTAGTELVVSFTFKTFQPVVVAFKLDRNFHPPSNKLPIYFSKHSFLI